MKNALVTILLVAVAVVLLRLLSGGGGGNGDEPQKNSGQGGKGFSIKPEANHKRILLEAESAQEVAPPVSVVSGAEGPLAVASCGKSCYIGPEKWNDKWEKGQIEGEWRKGHAQAHYPGFAKYEFDAPEDGAYVLWIRAFWSDGCGNSVDVSVNGSQPGGITGSVYGKWVWLKYRNFENEPVRCVLKKGKNTLLVLNREDDLYFDQILLLGADEQWPDPSDAEK